MSIPALSVCQLYFKKTLPRAAKYPTGAVTVQYIDPRSMGYWHQEHDVACLFTVGIRHVIMLCL